MRPPHPARTPLSFGLYEQLIDEGLESRLTAVPEGVDVHRARLDPAESVPVLAQHLAHLIARALAMANGPESVEQRVDACNRIIALLEEQFPASAAESQMLPREVEQLLAVLRGSAGILRKGPIRPETPLATSCLLTGTGQDPSLVSQLRKELLTSDRVDILCSFIKWSGIRILEQELRAFDDQPASRLRVITTSYMGATDLKAVEFLRNLRHAEVRISYDTARTRLHAKAYLFHRESQFGTAYIGSSNLSHAALTDGLEWNLKVSQYESEHLWERVCGTFESYWEDSEFVPYSAADKGTLDAALDRERGSAYMESPGFQFEVRPYPYQQEILDALRAEREIQGHFRNLVVAATGTGKTVIAALDYHRFLEQSRREKRPARLFFVAHREEILKQARDCFRAILRDPNFGDLLVGNHLPDAADHLFVSIQSYSAKSMHRLTAPDAYDFVVVDEFHHAAAPSYQSLLSHIQPRVLLGLTATPERADGLSILPYFDNEISAEIRLPSAINRKLLSPFQYFGITDTENLNDLRWQRGGYSVDDLDQRYTGNDERAGYIVKAVREKLLDPSMACGLGFCVSIQHAEYMAVYFNRAGIPAEALSTNSSRDVRDSVKQRLVKREINFVFVVDLYNEGVDIPQIDTILLLRPTESLTVFLQQLGRGLRLWEGKDCLTVLDFIGQAHRNYRFDIRFRALMENPNHRLDREIEAGCPHLPAGCVIQLERMAQHYILDNIRSALNRNRENIIRQIASFADDAGQPRTLGHFLDYYNLRLQDLYRWGTWSRLCAEASLSPNFSEPDETTLQKGFRRLAHINGPMQIQRLQQLLAPNAGSDWDFLSERHLLLLHFTLWGPGWKCGNLEESVGRLKRNPTLYHELLELLDYRLRKVVEVPPPLMLPFPCPLELHADYSRDQILAAFGYWNLQTCPSMREGVLHLPESKADLLLVTLDKTEKDYSPSTLYEDYAISDRLFHWQSQSTTSETSETGRRYINHSDRGYTPLLFVREKKNHSGLACPYSFLGPVEYVTHAGSRPMSITWRLRHPLPARLVPGTVRMVPA